jgi:hypothetical protein
MNQIGKLLIKNSQLNFKYKSREGARLKHYTVMLDLNLPKKINKFLV